MRLNYKRKMQQNAVRIPSPILIVRLVLLLCFPTFYTGSG